MAELGEWGRSAAQMVRAGGRVGGQCVVGSRWEVGLFGYLTSAWYPLVILVLIYMGWSDFL